MEYIAIILIALSSGVIGTGIGGLIGVILKKDSNRTVSLLLSFAGGVMLAVVCFDLMVEPLDSLTGTSYQSITRLLIILAVAVGYVLIWVLNVVIDNKTNHELEHSSDIAHPKTADDLDELIHSDHYEKHKSQNESLFVAGLVMMFAIALHNFPEGMVIGASYTEHTDMLANIFTASGFIMAVVIGLHNIPEGMAVSVPLVSGGMSKAKAIILTALSGLPTVIGAVVGFAVGGISPLMSLIAVGFASGAMLYVILGELLPEAILMWKSKLPALATFVGVLLGFALVAI